MNKVTEKIDLFMEHPAAATPSDQVNLETQVFRFQRWTLQFFGFAPRAEPRSIFVYFALRAISIIILIAAAIELFYQVSVLVSQLRHPTSKEKNNVILTTMVYAPYIAQSARGLIVLLIVVSKRHSWQHLAHFADEIVRETFPESDKRKRQLRCWRKFALTFGVGMIGVHLCWELAVFTMDAEEILLIIPGSDKNQSFFYVEQGNEVTSFEYFIANLTHDRWWNVAATVAEAVPFCLSQQIFTIIIVLAFLLNSGVKIVNEKIEKLRLETEDRLDVEEARNVHDWEVTTRKLDDWSAAELTKKLAAIQNYHLRLVLFSHEINHFFGWILFGVYGMDAVCLLGFVALVVTGDHQLPMERVCYLLSIAMFGLFATLFYVPLVQAQEEAAKVTTGLHRLLGMTAKIEVKEIHIQNRLEAFCIASKRHYVIFEGAKLLHITRMFIVTTCTMTLSIAILAYEILNVKEN